MVVPLKLLAYAAGAAHLASIISQSPNWDRVDFLDGRTIAVTSLSATGAPATIIYQTKGNPGHALPSTELSTKSRCLVIALVSTSMRTGTYDLDSLVNMRAVYNYREGRHAIMLVSSEVHSKRKPTVVMIGKDWRVVDVFRLH